MSKKEFGMSASSIETYLKCSLLYYGKYVLKTPDTTNDGALRGSVCHDIFEILIFPKYIDRVNLIIKEGNIYKDLALIRLIKSKMYQYKLSDISNKNEDNFKMICDMIFVGLNFDFYCKDWEIDYDNLETLFHLRGTPEKYYYLRGKIDKPVKNGGQYGIFDYKSSSKQKIQSELDFSIQGLSYILYAKRVLGMDAFAEFIFLRFPDDPAQRVEVDSDTLDGFEDWLADLYAYLKEFDESKKNGNLAYDKGYPKDGTFTGQLVCGYGKFPGHSYSDTHKDKDKRGKEYFCCSLKFPFIYYIVLDKNGNIVDSSKDYDLLESQYNSENIEVREWEGCPKWTNKLEYLNWKDNNNEENN